MVEDSIVGKPRLQTIRSVAFLFTFESAVASTWD